MVGLIKDKRGGEVGPWGPGRKPGKGAAAHVQYCRDASSRGCRDAAANQPQAMRDRRSHWTAHSLAMMQEHSVALQTRSRVAAWWHLQHTHPAVLTACSLRVGSVLPECTSC